MNSIRPSTAISASISPARAAYTPRCTGACMRLASCGYTNATKALAANYALSDIVAFHRPYKHIGIDHRSREVLFDNDESPLLRNVLIWHRCLKVR